MADVNAVLEEADKAFWTKYSESVSLAPSSWRPGKGVAAEDAKRAGVAGDHARAMVIIQAFVEEAKTHLRGFDGEPGHGGEFISVNEAQKIFDELVEDWNEED